MERAAAFSETKSAAARRASRRALRSSERESEESGVEDVESFSGVSEVRGEVEMVGFSVVILEAREGCERRASSARASKRRARAEGCSDLDSPLSVGCSWLVGCSW